MKFFVLGALASGLLLYGMSMIYGATGTLEITTIAERLYMGQADKDDPRFRPRSSWFPAWPSSSASFPSTCGFPTSIMARRRRSRCSSPRT
jgi:hypothetical protein